jgi:hypothetical protein
MAKTNFTKVEEILNEGLRKISAEQLLELADAAPPLQPAERDKAARSVGLRAQHRALLTLTRDLKRLQKLGKEPYKALGVSKEYLKNLLGLERELTTEELEKVSVIKKDLQKFKEELKAKPPKVSDDAIVEEQIKEHKNKRFNIRKEWLPLR